jgi:cation transport ATPase
MPDSDDPQIQNPKSQIQNLLYRPDDQRLREYKYRFAQSVVFGLPVIALQYFGLRLGGAEAAAWVGLLQALLAGWVMYVGAAGMLFEGLLLRKVTADALAALLALVLFLFSAAGVVLLIVSHDRHSQTFYFHASVAVLIVWCGLQWQRWSRKLSRAAR